MEIRFHRLLVDEMKNSWIFQVKPCIIMKLLTFAENFNPDIWRKENKPILKN